MVGQEIRARCHSGCGETQQSSTMTLTLPEIGIASALSLALVASAALAVVMWPAICAVLLIALAAGILEDMAMGRGH